MIPKLKILLLEDSELDAKLIIHELKKHFPDSSIELASDQISFEKSLKTFEPDLVLSDFKLPHYTGLDAIIFMKHNYPEIPIIIVTGSLDEETAVECMRQGAWDYIIKDRLVLLKNVVLRSLELKEDRSRIEQYNDDLKKNEEQFRSFAENVPGVVSIYDHYPDGRNVFRYLGPGLDEILGAELAEEVQKNTDRYFSFLPVEDRDRINREAIEALQKDDFLDTEYRLEIKPGKTIWVRSRFRATHLPNNVYRWQGIIFEITNQKMMEDELIRNEKLLRKTQKMARVGSWIFDYNSRHFHFSSQVYDILGLNSKDFKPDGVTIYDLIHPDDKDKVQHKIKNAYDNKESQTEVYHRVIDNSGKILYIHTIIELDYDESGTLSRIIGMSQDISNIVETQEMIRQTEQLALAVINESPLGISIRDKNGTLLLYNEAWKKMWKLKVDDLNKKRVKRNHLVFDETDSYLGEHQQKVEEIYRQGGVYIIPELHLQRTDKWFSQSFYALMDENHEVDRVVIITEDITDRKKDELTHRVLYEIANFANTAASLDDLFQETRKQLGRILDTTNIFIALYDEESGILTLPFMMDQRDHFSEFPAGKTLSGYVIKTGKPQLISERDAKKLTEEGIIESFGTPSAVWMGAPLVVRNQIIGVIVLQSYDNENLYSAKDLELLSFVSSEIASAIDNKRAEEEIAIQKSYFENLFQMSPDALVILSNDDRVIQINQEFTNLFGYREMEAVGSLINDLIVPQELKEEALVYTKSVAERKRVRFESVRCHKNGTKINIECIGKPIMLKGNQLAVMAIYRDISERIIAKKRIEQELEEKDILLKEVHHRVKNNMQIISSLLNMQKKMITDPAIIELFTNTQNRVKSMSLIHERIYRSKDLSSIDIKNYITRLVMNLFISYEIYQDRIKLDLHIEDIPINMNEAVPLGLILNELISNALKHAFPGDRKGNLKISFTRDNDRKILIVADDGVGSKVDLNFADPKTLGVRLLGSLSDQLRGEISYKKEGGSIFTLIF
jgi:PAS domain S-box-containing protein